MKTVIETIKSEMNNLKPFYDEYIRLKCALELLDESIAKEAKPVVKDKPKTETNPVKVQGKRGRHSKDGLIYITNKMKASIMNKYNLHVGDYFASKERFTEVTGINHLTPWINKGWIEYRNN